MPRSDCPILTTHGRVLSYVAVRPDATLRQIADDLDVTERTVIDVVGDLKNAHVINVARQGRRNTYAINPDARLTEPALSKVTVGEFTKLLSLDR